MKRIVLLLISFVVLLGKTQSQNYYSDIDYEKIKHVDERISNKKIYSNNIKRITRKITEDYNTDLEKVRAIFVWITHNIKYDCKQLKKKRKRKTVKCHTDIECDRKIQELQRRETQKALRRRKGVCEDYSRIFKKMCELSGIEAGYISGKTKTKVYQVGRKPSGRGHAWNWAKINGEIYLFDSTWGSGYVDEKCTNFFYKFKDEYFMIPPKVMILTHYPKNHKYQFLNKIVSKEEFGNPPLYKQGFKKYKVIDFQPSLGLIKESQKEVCFKIKILETIDKITLFDQKDRFDFNKEDDYFIFNYQIPEKPKRKIQLNIYLRNGEQYPLLTYRIQIGV